MKVLVFGATGATGRLAVRQLVDRNIEVKIVVRQIERVPPELRSNRLVECIVGNITEFDHVRYRDLIEDCDAVVSCLGHNITVKGIFGKPRLLVTDTVKNVCETILESKQNKIKFVLMNTTANRNTKANEKYSFADRIVLSFFRLLVPPQNDNEKAAQYLLENIHENNRKIEWTAVRPDTLVNETEVSAYELCESPRRSPVFNAGKTSRINVGRFMAELLTDETVWEKWKFKMPVIYNREGKSR